MEHLLRGLYLIIGSIVAAVFVGSVVDIKIASYEEDKTFSDMREIARVDEITKSLDCLALNIYKEAGYEPFEGKVAVAQVTMNRVEDPRFPDSVCDVVYQKNAFTARVVCQFSWYCDSVHRTRPVNPEAYNESYEIAKKVLLEDFRLPSLTEALYYHADYVSPNFHMRQQRISQIGAHIFYTDGANNVL